MCHKSSDSSQLFRDTTVQITDKVNHILVDRCSNTRVSFVSLVSSLEVVHAENITYLFFSGTLTIQGCILVDQLDWYKWISQGIACRSVFRLILRLGVWQYT